MIFLRVKYAQKTYFHYFYLFSYLLRSYSKMLLIQSFFYLVITWGASVCSHYHNKTPQTGQLKHQTFIFHSSVQ